MSADPRTGAQTGAGAGAPGPRRLVVHTDGGSRGNPGVAGYGAVVTDADTGAVLAERSEYIGTATNNVAEYRGVLAGLEAAALIDPGAHVEVRADSKLVVEQMSGRWKIKHTDMKDLAQRARAVLPPSQVTYTWVPRAQNAAADALANKAMDTRSTHHSDAWRDAEAPQGGQAGENTGGQIGATGAETTHEGSAERPLHLPMGRPQGTPVTVTLVRHGVTAQTVGGRMAGGDNPGPDLTDAGRAQAVRAASILARLDEVWSGVPAPTRLVSSPLVRARSTAAVLGESLGLEPQFDERLIEVRFGEWAGRPSAVVEARDERLTEFMSTGRAAAPGGESLLDVGRRMGAFLSEVAHNAGAGDGGVAGETVVAVSHSVAIRCAIGLALGADPGRWWMLRIPPASVSVLRLWPATDPRGGPEVEVVAVGVPGELLP